MMIKKKVALRHKCHLKQEGRAWVINLLKNKDVLSQES
jgi:hypothetical protein